MGFVSKIDLKTSIAVLMQPVLMRGSDDVFTLYELVASLHSRLIVMVDFLF